MKSGYSGTPLEKKLGLKNSFNCWLLNAPSFYLTWFENLKINLIRDSKNEESSKDFIHLFCMSQEELENSFTHAKKALKKDGMLWVSWPKGSCAIKTDLKREPIRNYILMHGLVDIKVASINDDWSGLKFVYRLKDRQ